MELRGLRDVELGLPQREPRGAQPQLQMVGGGVTPTSLAKLRAEVGHAARGSHRGEILERQSTVEMLFHEGDGALHGVRIGEGVRCGSLLPDGMQMLRHEGDEKFEVSRDGVATVR